MRARGSGVAVRVMAVGVTGKVMGVSGKAAVQACMAEGSLSVGIGFPMELHRRNVSAQCNWAETNGNDAL